ncbi:MAG TPA: FmdE family protein [Acidimicrobiales bacterium]|nr:FmdE family protein [Acidimicrobiales bacterium]
MTLIDTIDQAAIDRAVAYHGSLCPGLAVGIQAARLALAEVGRADEQNKVVAVAETDICAIDAIQAIVGTTVGNRNLIVQDWGKNAFTFFRLTDGKAVRVTGRPAWAAEYQALRAKVQAGLATAEEVERFKASNQAEVERILSLPPEELYEVQAISAAPPRTSQVDTWITCTGCGETVMESRTRLRRGQAFCVPCFEAARAAA